jgi:hypothetical protein
MRGNNDLPLGDQWFPSIFIAKFWSVRDTRVVTGSTDRFVGLYANDVFFIRKDRFRKNQGKDEIEAGLNFHGDDILKQQSILGKCDQSAGDC